MLKSTTLPTSEHDFLLFSNSESNSKICGKLFNNNILEKARKILDNIGDFDNNVIVQTKNLLLLQELLIDYDLNIELYEKCFLDLLNLIQLANEESLMISALKTLSKIIIQCRIEFLDSKSASFFCFAMEILRTAGPFVFTLALENIAHYTRVSNHLVQILYNSDDFGNMLSSIDFGSLHNAGHAFCCYGNMIYYIQSVSNQFLSSIIGYSKVVIASGHLYPTEQAIIALYNALFIDSSFTSMILDIIDYINALLYSCSKKVVQYCLRVLKLLSSKMCETDQFDVFQIVQLLQNPDDDIVNSSLETIKSFIVSAPECIVPFLELGLEHMLFRIHCTVPFRTRLLIISIIVIIIESRDQEACNRLITKDFIYGILGTWNGSYEEIALLKILIEVGWDIHELMPIIQKDLVNDIEELLNHKDDNTQRLAESLLYQISEKSSS